MTEAMGSGSVVSSLGGGPGLAFWRSVVAGALMLGLSGPILAEAGVTLAFEDEIGPIGGTLEIGRSLLVETQGMGQGATGKLIVRDSSGWVITQRAVVADDGGYVPPILLWDATGVVGCDCGTVPGLYDFARLESAIEQLAGQTVDVELLDEVGNTVVSKALALIETVRPVAFPADSTGCPRFRLQSHEDLHVLIWGGQAGDPSHLMLSPASASVPFDFRTAPPEGPSFALGSPSTLVLIWGGEESSLGDYQLIAGGTGWPTTPILPIGGINSGVVVHDHACPPPPKGP